MKQFLLTVFAASIANILTGLFSQGFKRSYWFKNAVQEVTRFFNRYCKHYQKMKRNEKILEKGLSGECETNPGQDNPFIV